MSNQYTNSTHEKLEKLERTVLELGSELFQLKGTIENTSESHEQLLSIFDGLKQLLDEKGLITVEDFEGAVELGQAIEVFNSSQEHAVHTELERVKKSSH